MPAIKPRTATVVIYQGDDLARLTELDDAATRAEVAKIRADKAAKDAARRVASLDEAMTEQDDLIAAEEAYDLAVLERDEFAAEAEERGVLIVMHHLPNKEWRRLKAAHPPREGDDEDAQFEVNVDTMPEELFAKMVDPDASTIEGPVDEFLDSLSSADYYNRLFMTALALNVGSAGADPTLRLATASR